MSFGKRTNKWSRPKQVESNSLTRQVWSGYISEKRSYIV